MSAQEIETFLILKYGSMIKALEVWLDRGQDFTAEEQQALTNYGIAVKQALRVYCRNHL